MRCFSYALVFSLLVAFTCAQVYNAGLTASCQPPSGVPDQFDLGTCNCFSGYAPSSPLGTDCNARARCAGVSADKSDSTAGNQPRRPITTFSNDQLTIVQKVAVVSNRQSSRIKFVQPLINGMLGNTPGVAGADTCSYPGALWTKTVDNLDCQDVFTAVLPWAQASLCGFVKDTSASNNEKTVLKTTVVHSYNETYMSGKKVMTRTLSTSYLIAVSFLIQKIVTSEKFAVTIADPTALGFINVVVLGDALYDVATGNIVMRFRTTAAWPYKLNTNDISFIGVTPAVTGITTGSITITEEADGSNQCDGTQDSSCSQTWSVSIAAPAGLCDIKGVYAFQDSLDCRDNTAASPCLTASPKPANFTINVKQTDLCVADAIDTTAENKYTLTPFFAPTDSAPTFAYQTGDMIYWQLSVIDPLATIDTVTFSNIMVFVTTQLGVAQSDTLFDGTITAHGTASQLSVVEARSPVAPGEPALLTFQYKLSRAALQNTIAQLTSSSLVVEVTTSVTIDILYRGNQKRSMERSTTSTQARAVQFTIAPEAHETPAVAPKEGGEEQEETVSSIFGDLSNSATSSMTAKSFVGLFVAVVVAVALKF